MTHMKETSIIVMGLATAMLLSAAPAMATVDFTALTDLINATVTIFSTFNTNGSTIIGFFVLLGELTVVGAVIAFVVVMFKKIGAKIGGKVDESS